MQDALDGRRILINISWFQAEKIMVDWFSVK